ncbi:NAD(P)-binding protein [Mycena albidolilacea]|uniref:NAD(P)-binding protein n=1 Tax=Mycena albidolilacea TaxID=1033008 RepID=A0AAD7ELY8_9AGAR|nr:NAD(P)-binding protein [Mycena albidolilacea]
MASIAAYLFPPRFLPERDMPDLSGKIALVTGGNTGIGYHTVKQLLLKNAKVYLAARSPDKAAAAIKRLEEETKGKKAIFLKLDLADLSSVRKATEGFLALESRLDLLFNNGGVMISPPEMLTAQGHDLQFGTNCIGHFFFTELLLPVLLKTHAETGTRARIMHTSSIGHQFAPGRGFELVSLKGGPERDAWVKKAGTTMGPWRLYGESKLGNILVANYFARAHGDKIVSFSLHPGGIKTELGRHGGTLLQVAGNLFAYPAPMGAHTQLWGATIPEEDEVQGKYLVPWGKIGKVDPRASDRAQEDEVIAYVREQIQGF